MEKPGFNLNQAVVTALAVVGLVALGAVIFNYTGQLQLKLGADGIQLEINGSSE